MQEKLTTEPRVIKIGEPSFVYDVAALINTVYQTTIELTREDTVPKRITKKIRPLLKGQERLGWNENDLYIDMIIQNLLGAKILTQIQPPIDGSKFRLAPGPGFEQWARKNLVEQTSLLLDGWQKSHNWIDVPLVSSKAPEYYYDAYSSSLHTRPLLLERLHTYSVGSWYDVKALVQEIWEAYPELARQQKWKGERFFNNYANRNKKEQKRDLFAEWSFEAAPAIINMLYSSLLELGIVDIGNDPLEDGVVLRLSSCAFRITELGSQAIAQVISAQSSKAGKAKNSNNSKNADTIDVTQEPPYQKSLIVQPTYEILQLQMDLPTLYRILPFTQVKQIQMVSTLLLTQSSVLRALQHGFNVKKMLATLQELSQKELPQNVVYSLQDWVRQHKQATISRMALLELSDEETATRLALHPTLIKMNVRQLAPTLLAIPLNESGNVNYQIIQQLMDKENISLNFLGASNSTRYRDIDYY